MVVMHKTAGGTYQMLCKGYEYIVYSMYKYA